jgi:glyoxylase-like metal-dependent hydrolase (beta-lactamase superfamily II)
MKYLASIILFLTAMQLPLSASAGTPVPDKAAEKISDHVYVIHGPTSFPNPENLGFMNNPAIVIGSDSVAILDPGSSLESGRMVLRQVAKLTDKPVTLVINSHIHGDHWLGNQAIREQYPDVKLYAHPEMIKKAKESEARVWVEMMDTLTEGATAGTVAVIPENTLENGQELKVGGLTLRIHIVPAAHSYTDVMTEVVEDSLLYTGDNVTYKRLPRFDDGTFRGSIAACDHALSLNLKHYVPGHGPSGGPEVIESFRTYTKTLYDSAAEMYEEGMADFEMKDEISNKLEPFHAWSGYDEFLGRTISLAIIEAEKASFE